MAKKDVTIIGYALTFEETGELLSRSGAKKLENPPKYFTPPTILYYTELQDAKRAVQRQPIAIGAIIAIQPLAATGDPIKF